MPDATEELIFAVQPKRESIVWQQNQLAEARYKLSPREQKLLLYVIAMIEPEAEDFGEMQGRGQRLRGVDRAQNR